MAQLLLTTEKLLCGADAGTAPTAAFSSAPADMFDDDDDDEDGDGSDSESSADGGESGAKKGRHAETALGTADFAAAVAVLSRADVGALLPLLLQRGSADVKATCEDVLPATVAATSAWKTASMPLSVVQVCRIVRHEPAFAPPSPPLNAHKFAHACFSFRHLELPARHEPARLRLQPPRPQRLPLPGAL
jgi:hypothetical protein